MNNPYPDDGTKEADSFEGWLAGVLVGVIVGLLVGMLVLRMCV